MKTAALVLHQGRGIDWRQFEQSLHDRFGVNAVALDTNGDRKTADDMLWANDLCARIKTHVNGAGRICGLVQRILMRRAAEKRRYAADECAAGMYRLMVPVVVEDRLAGFISACGRPFSNAERIYTEYIHRTIGEDEPEIERLVPALNPIGPRTLREMRRFITGWVH